MEPDQNTPQAKPSYTAWVLGVNLGILLLMTLLGGGDLGFIVGTITGLSVINGVAALLMLWQRKMHYVVAFLLAFFLILLIGGGACALILISVNPH